MQWNSNIIIYLIISYLIGSIPFSYLLVKYLIHKDLRTEGSGNLGTLNSYEVSKNKWIGVSVLILDIIKGITAVYLIDKLSSGNSYTILLSGLMAVIGHNWNIFLKFRGGRGLAIAAGISIALNFFPVAIWLLIWLSCKKLFVNIHKANLLSSILSIGVLWIVPLAWFSYFDSLCLIGSSQLRIQFSLINILIVLGHWNVLQSLFRKQ